ncbi:hypothetical protein RHECNPAF_2940075 [Rhizobium etli CNPAF512]|nr:hypothetical protein RHECNPAF_2940075 [Rhizobium etli CNPAF512]
MASAAGSGLGPPAMHIEAFAGQKHNGFIKRQADDIGVGADHLLHEGAGQALDAVGARLAAPLAGGQVVFDLEAGQPLEAHLGLDDLLADLAIRRHQTNAGIDEMVASGQKMQRTQRFVGKLGLAENAPADGDHRIGGKDITALPGDIALDGGKRGFRLFGRKPSGERTRMLRLLRRLVDIHRHQARRLDACLVEQVDATRRTRSENELVFQRHGTSTIGRREKDPCRTLGKLT